jgi:hypothetical protein
MEQTGNGVISPTDLMAKLAKAKKVMNQVERGNYKPGKMNESISRSDDDYEFDMDNTPIYDQTERLTENTNTNYGQQPLDINKINQSRLPDAIKRAMIEKPIIQPDISLSDGLDMNIIKGAKRIMEQDNPSPRKKPLTEQTRPQPQVVTGDLIKTITPIIENIIRKVMDEKLTQLLTAQKTQSINENLVLKVGDSIFKGKITGVQSSK